MKDVESKTSEGTEAQLSSEGAETKGQGAVEPSEESPASQRTYSEEEWNKRQAALDRQLNEARERYKQQLKELREQQSEIAAQLAAQMRSDFLKKAEEDGLDLKQAERLYDWEQANKAKEKELSAKLREIEEGSKAVAAHKLIRELSLSEEVLPSLLEAPSPEAMEAKALRLKLEGGKAPPKVNSVEGPTPTKGVDLN